MESTQIHNRTNHASFFSKTLMISMSVLLASTSLIISSSPIAQASTFRGMTWNRYDLLLNGTETQSGATTTWGPVRVCSDLVSNVSTAMRGALNPKAPTLSTAAIGAIVFFGETLCGRQVAICASKAFYDHKWAGMTVTLLPLRSWCWEY